MAESWGEDDEVIDTTMGGVDDWGVDDEEVVTPAPEPEGREGAFGGVMDTMEQAGRDYLGRGEAALTMASSVLAEPIAGVAGIAGALLPGEEGQGADMVEAVREGITYQPRLEEGQGSLQTVGQVLGPMGEWLGGLETFLGDNTMDLTGSPLAATAATAAPTALMELLGLGTLKKTSKAAQQANRAKEVADGAIDAADTAPVRMVMEDLEAPTRTVEEITADVAKKKSGRLAEDVKPDLQIMADAQELGISLNPSHYSTNDAYRRVEQAVKDQPGTLLAERELKAMRDLSAKGDELLRELGGDTDRGILAMDVEARMDDAIKGMEDSAEMAYKQIRDHIPPATKVENPVNSRTYINQRVEALGGDLALLAPVERKLYNLLNRTKKAKGPGGKMIDGDPIPPTYEAIDTLRKDISSGYKNQGPYKDDVSGTLDQVYSVLINDQGRAAQGMGVGKEFLAAQKMVKNRKRIEQRAMTLFGKKMEKDFLPKLTQSATKLTKGEIKQFEGLMQALPADMRQRSAATMLNDLYTLGARNKAGGIGQGFANAYDSLERNASAKKALFKYLPEDAESRFDALGRVSRGLYRAKAMENTSKTARSILQALEEGTLAERVISGAAGGAARVAGWKAGGHFGAAAADRIDRGVKSMVKNDRAADELLSSTAFEKALNKAMEGKVKEAEMMLNRSEVWRRWRNTVGEGTKTQLATLGAIGYLTKPAEEEEAQPNGE